MSGNKIVNLNNLKKSILVFDIETSAVYDSGREVNISTNFDDYVALAQCKWFGAFSYRDNKEYYFDVSKNRNEIIQLLNSHDILVGFNSQDFDYPILVNNRLCDEQKRYIQVDCMNILGSSTFKDKSGHKYKGRGELMNYKFKKNSLECMAETMELEFQKSEIDYKIFQKNSWTKEEQDLIIKYLRNDVMATKGMFDKLWDYWYSFTDLISEKDVLNLSWIRSSIAALIYKSACHHLSVEPTYAENPKKKEEMGGRVLPIKYEEAEGVWYVDFTSLYPHIFVMFNLFAETTENNVIAWHGNDLFKVKGYYDVSYQHPLSLEVKKKLKERVELKEKDPNNSMVYTIKIWLNGLYGVARSALFEKIHTENCGWDCCWLGQQIQELTQDMMLDFGFEAIGGDTDSLKLKALKEENNNRKYVQKCLDKIVKKIFENVPFPVETFDIKIENYLEYLLWPFAEEPVVDKEIRSELKDGEVKGYIKALDENDKKVIIEEGTGKIVKNGNRWVKERRGRKKNYMYLYKEGDELKLEIVGLPIKKDNATPLGFKIFNEVLKPLILKNKRAKFTKEFIDKTIEDYLKDEEILKLLAVEFKIKPFSTYKNASQIQAQISKGYFNGQDGVIHLIKNKKVGKAGKGNKYCTISEAREANLSVDELELEKLYNELQPFIIYEKLSKPLKSKKKQKSLTTK